ncbi:MAG: hypothetical protein Q4F97_06615 [Bacteroidales bacterium]|nr:hypothetical protein [Bacteroidales bacterium]
MHLQTLIAVCVFSLLAPAVKVNHQSQSYEQILSKDWERAMECVAENGQMWNEVFAEFDLDARECEAIVFPELLRYSHLRDYMEQGAVRALYVQGGKQSADFSIGMFQMKPSFIEMVESAWMHSTMRHEYGLYFDCSDNVQARSARIKRLVESKWQCIYLSMFVRLIIKREVEIAAMTADRRVGLLATAYNVDFAGTVEQLNKWQKMRRFYLDFIPTASTIYYAYADIAVAAFNDEKLIPNKK